MNAVQLAVIYYSTRYGLVRLTVRNVRQVVGRVGLALRLVGRTLPLLLLAVTFLLFSGPAWQGITRTPLPQYVGLLVLFVGFTLVFVYWGVEIEFETVSTLESREAIGELSAGSPVGPIAATTDVTPSEVAPLTPKERLNVLLMATCSFSGYVTVVTLAMLVFFVLFGLLAIPAEVVPELIRSAAHPIVTVTLSGVSVTLIRELVRLSGVLNVVPELYFTVHAVTD